MRRICILLVFPLIILACSKSDPPISITPQISFVSVNPSSVRQFKDSLVFTISYKDGDGDLGQNDPNATNLFLTDNRINITYAYRVSQLSPTGSVIAITGNLNILLKSTEITDSSSSQQATYSIYMVDRAGHKSNTVTSGPVTITK